MVYLLFAIALTALLGLIYPMGLPIIFTLSVVLLLYLIWRSRSHNKPILELFSRQDDIALQRVKKRRNDHTLQREKHLNQQIEYIATAWGYSESQEKVIQQFVADKVYLMCYDRLTASLLPHIITLIEQCNQREKKGCKNEVNRRIKALIALLKQEIHQHKEREVEIFEVNLEVYDRLLQE